MADEVYEFDALIPAGTPQGSPAVVPLTMPERLVDELEVVVPPGPRGTVHFAIGAAGVPVLPSGRGQFVNTDDEKIRWPLARQIESGAWQLIGWSSGQFDHTIHVRFLVSVIQDVAQTLGAGGIPNGQLAGDAGIPPLDTGGGGDSGPVLPPIPPPPYLPPPGGIPFSPRGGAPAGGTGSGGAPSPAPSAGPAPFPTRTGVPAGFGGFVLPPPPPLPPLP